MPEVTYIGHACVEIRTPKIVFCVDPYFEPSINFDGLVSHPEISPPNNEWFHQVDAVHISHIHNDHYCIKSLKKFRPDIKIFIAQYSNRLFFDLLKKNGFKNVYELPESIGVPCADLTLTSYQHKPFDGTFDSALVIEADSTALFLNNDCILQDDDYEKIFRNHSNLSIGFLGYSGVTPFPVCYNFEGDSFADKVCRIRHAQDFYINHFRKVVTQLKLDTVVPYANGLRCLQTDFEQLNQSFVLPTDSRLFEGLDSKPLIMNYLDRIIVSNQKIVSHAPAIPNSLDLSVRRKTFPFTSYDSWKNQDPRPAILNFIKSRARIQNSSQDFHVGISFVWPQQKSPFSEGIEVQSFNGKISVNWIEAKQLSTIDFDMTVTYPGALFFQCAIAAAFVGQIHYGFHHRVDVRRLKHAFFLMISGRSPGQKHE